MQNTPRTRKVTVCNAHPAIRVSVAPSRYVLGQRIFDSRSGLTALIELDAGLPPGSRRQAMPRVEMRASYLSFSLHAAPG
jgi:hypothetical protein